MYIIFEFIIGAGMWVHICDNYQQFSKLFSIWTLNKFARGEREYQMILMDTPSTQVPKSVHWRLIQPFLRKRSSQNINKYNCYLKGCSFTHRKWSKKNTKCWSNLAGHAASLENKDGSHFGLRPFAKSGKTIKGELSGRSQPAVSVRISTWM